MTKHDKMSLLARDINLIDAFTTANNDIISRMPHAITPWVAMQAHRRDVANLYEITLTRIDATDEDSPMFGHEGDTPPTRTEGRQRPGASGQQLIRAVLEDRFRDFIINAHNIVLAVAFQRGDTPR